METPSGGCRSRSGDASLQGASWATPQRLHAERNEALKLVAHFVGDVHQPLHTGRSEDLGGNRLPVNFFGDSGSAERPVNLHSVWDTDILGRAEHAWPQIGQRLNAQITPQCAQWETLDVVAWTNETYRIADDFAYPELPRAGFIGNSLSTGARLF